MASASPPSWPKSLLKCPLPPHITLAASRDGCLSVTGHPCPPPPFILVSIDALVVAPLPPAKAPAATGSSCSSLYIFSRLPFIPRPVSSAASLSPPRCSCARCSAGAARLHLHTGVRTPLRPCCCCFCCYCFCCCCCWGRSCVARSRAHCAGVAAAVQAHEKRQGAGAAGCILRQLHSS